MMPPQAKAGPEGADRNGMDAAERKEILSRYRDHSRRFEAAAARRSTSRSGSVVPFNPPVLRELAQEPTAREIEAHCLTLLKCGVSRQIQSPRTPVQPPKRGMPKRAVELRI